MHERYGIISCQQVDPSAGRYGPECRPEQGQCQFKGRPSEEHQMIVVTVIHCVGLYKVIGMSRHWGTVVVVVVVVMVVVR